MSDSTPILEAGNLLGQALLNPDLPSDAKRHIHDAMNTLTKAVMAIELPQFRPYQPFDFR